MVSPVKCEPIIHYKYGMLTIHCSSQYGEQSYIKQNLSKQDKYPMWQSSMLSMGHLTTEKVHDKETCKVRQAYLQQFKSNSQLDGQSFLKVSKL